MRGSDFFGMPTLAEAQARSAGRALVRDLAAHGVVTVPLVEEVKRLVDVVGEAEVTQCATRTDGDRGVATGHEITLRTSCADVTADLREDGSREFARGGS